MYYDVMIFIQQYKVYEMAFLLGHGCGYRSACWPAETARTSLTQFKGHIRSSFRLLAVSINGQKLTLYFCILKQKLRPGNEAISTTVCHYIPHKGEKNGCYGNSCISRYSAHTKRGGTVISKGEVQK